MNIVLIGAMTFVFAGSCAASNGGGHTVGNSIISESAATKTATEKKTETICACASDPKAKATCKCATETAPPPAKK